LASISGTNIKELAVLLPPGEEQRGIKQYLSDNHKRHKTLQEDLRKSIALLQERRSALITAAVTGQIPMEEMTA
jgi:type I restriction enzyme S subunit